MRPLATVLFLVASALPLWSQSAPDRFEAAIKFSDGRFVADRTTAKVILSERFRKLLRPGVTAAQLTGQFSDALDRELRLMPKPYYFTLTDAQKALDQQGKLTAAQIPDIEARRHWSKSIVSFPDLEIFLLERTNPGNFNSLFEQVREHSSLAEWTNEDARIDRPLQFRIRDPLLVDELQTPQTGTLLRHGSILKKLKPLDRLPANPEAIRAILLDFYTPRGLTPKINLGLDSSPPTLSIFENTRIAKILLPAELTDLVSAEKIMYQSLPDPAYATFRKVGKALLSATLDPNATKREIDLSTLNIEPVPLDPSQLAGIQQRLQPLNYTASLFELDPDQLLFDLVIDAMAVEPGAAAADQPTNEPKESMSPVAAPAGSQPAPLVPAQPPNPRHVANTPLPEKKNFIGAGFAYKPDQGIRALTSFQRTNTLGQDLFGFEGGVMGSGFGTAHYTRNYLLFPTIGRPLSGDLEGGTDFQQQRVLDGVLINERRTGGSLRLDLEAFRDLYGHQLSFFTAGNHQTVRLTAADIHTSPRTEVAANLNTITTGLSETWQHSLSRHPATFSLDPSVEFGLGVSRTESSFRKLSLGAHYHLSIAGPIEFETRFQARWATSPTPVFELPSLGGPESVRGFRTDDSLGRRLWSSQNELWFPVLGSGAPSKLRDFVLRNVRLATLYDVGGIGLLAQGLPASLEGRRQGAGLGLRVKYQGVVIEADWAYGFGNDSAARPGRGRFYFNFRLP
jgi:hypothetical protein